MKIKTEFIGKDWGFYVINDETEFYKDVVNLDGEEVAKEYFAPGRFASSDEATGYAIGQIESIGQSDRCPPQLYAEDYEIVITHLNEEKETN